MLQMQAAQLPSSRAARGTPALPVTNPASKLRMVRTSFMQRRITSQQTSTSTEGAVTPVEAFQNGTLSFGFSAGGLLFPYYVSKRHALAWCLDLQLQFTQQMQGQLLPVKRCGNSDETAMQLTVNCCWPAGGSGRSADERWHPQAGHAHGRWVRPPTLVAVAAGAVGNTSCSCCVVAGMAITCCIPPATDPFAAVSPHTVACTAPSQPL